MTIKCHALERKEAPPETEQKGVKDMAESYTALG
jgi:hypothetical protein